MLLSNEKTCNDNLLITEITLTEIKMLPTNELPAREIDQKFDSVRDKLNKIKLNDNNSYSFIQGPSGKSEADSFNVSYRRQLNTRTHRLSYYAYQVLQIIAIKS